MVFGWGKSKDEKEREAEEKAVIQALEEEEIEQDRKDLEEFGPKYFLTCSAEEYAKSMKTDLSNYTLEAVDISYENSLKLGDDLKKKFIKKVKKTNAEAVVDIKISSFGRSSYPYDDCLILIGTALIPKNKKFPDSAF